MLSLPWPDVGVELCACSSSHMDWFLTLCRRISFTLCLSRWQMWVLTVFKLVTKMDFDYSSGWQIWILTIQTGDKSGFWPFIQVTKMDFDHSNRWQKWILIIQVGEKDGFWPFIQVTNKDFDCRMDDKDGLWQFKWVTKMNFDSLHCLDRFLPSVESRKEYMNIGEKFWEFYPTDHQYFYQPS